MESADPHAFPLPIRHFQTMGKLNIAHHKSYHPYRRDNIERVRRDEEEARIKEMREDGRMALAVRCRGENSAFGERASVGTSAKERRREDEKRERELLRQATDIDARAASASSSSLAGALGDGKHINLFEDLEQTEISNAISRTRTLDNVSKGKGKESAESERGVPLAPSVKDLKPWYSKKSDARDAELDEEKRSRDLSHKSRSDPLTAIQRELATRYPPAQIASSQSIPFSSHARKWGAPPLSESSKRGNAEPLVAPACAERTSRESSERARAQALKEQKRKEAAGSATPSTVRGGDINDDVFLYGNQFNARAVAEAHQRRGRGWDGEDDRPRSRSIGHDRVRDWVQRR